MARAPNRCWPTSGLAYARNRYVPLGRFLEVGRLPVDNGEVERLIKLIVLGRKNWLVLSDRLVDAPSITLPFCHAPPPLTPWAGPEAYPRTSSFEAFWCLLRVNCFTWRSSYVVGPPESARKQQYPAPRGEQGGCGPRGAGGAGQREHLGRTGLQLERARGVLLRGLHHPCSPRRGV
ncbi:transposase [Archangium violaceum]|uniref:IS66 family transposase n=1 Tax=Archangium violaceum TaxID=83451 RepID=UPI002B2DF008|nr:transposase [Archangium gephyra]